MEPKKQKKAIKAAKNVSAPNAEVFVIHLISALGLAVAFWIAQNIYSISFVSNPSHFLFLIWVSNISPFFGCVVVAADRVVRSLSTCMRHLPNTINWSLMMSSFTFICWPIGVIDTMICFPAHGAWIGGWFGAWSMPLDWESPWNGLYV